MGFIEFPRPLYTFNEVNQMVEDGRISLGNAILCWIRYKKMIE